MRAAGLSRLSRFEDFGKLVLRGIPGVIFLYHGYLKAQTGVLGFERFVRSLDIPLPRAVAWAVIFLELVGGGALIVGLLTRLTAVLFAIQMVFTTALVKVDVGLIAQGGAGAELDLALLAAMVGVAVFGPGRISFDRALGTDRR